MGRKIIFELADIKRHCVTTSNIGSTFVGNLKEKIPLNAVKKSEEKESIADSKKKNRKRQGKSSVKSKKKKRKISISSESSSSDSDSESESSKCADEQKDGIKKTQGTEAGGQNSGKESESDSGSGSENSESSSGAES